MMKVKGVQPVSRASPCPIRSHHLEGERLPVRGTHTDPPDPLPRAWVRAHTGTNRMACTTKRHVATYNSRLITSGRSRVNVRSGRPPWPRQNTRYR